MFFSTREIDPQELEMTEEAISIRKLNVPEIKMDVLDLRDPVAAREFMLKLLSKERPVLDKGFVRLDGHMADDLSVVNAARVSFATRKDVMDEADDGVLKFLMKNRHGTPFEHNAFRFHVKCPMFVAREWFRHRIGSFNEWSARYSVMKPEFYIPAVKDVRSQTGKPGSYTFEPVIKVVAEDFAADLERSSLEAYHKYEVAMRDGVAKELARCFLPVNIYTEFYWTINARSLMNFLSLRCHETAMYEIRQYANVILDVFKETMPVTAWAFVDSGMVAP